MIAAPGIRALPVHATPRQVVASWPRDRPLVMLHSARLEPRRARWSVLAEPETYYQFDGASRWVGSPPTGSVGDVAFTHEPLADLDRLLDAARSDPPHAVLPFVGGWIGTIAYELGRRLEPAAGIDVPPPDDRGWPLITLAWCPRALVYDHLAMRWWSVDGAALPPRRTSDSVDDSWRASPLEPGRSAAAYQQAVARALEYIRAGDIFQANLTQRFTAAFTGSTRGFALAALEQSGAWHGALLELPAGRAVVSMSPELFLQVDPVTRRVTTRPIKGTRPATADPEELRSSEKDAAELHMIIDLMRNDLGRVCAFGTVRVPQPRTIETHPTVHHGVGEVTGVLRPGVSAGDLLRATFPGGSVTGAPKIRAMQIIEELETAPRGPYCGAIGSFSRDGHVDLAIAIRTVALVGERAPGCWDRLAGGLDYGAGGGIVADSDPAVEWQECLDKTAVLRDVLARSGAIEPAVMPIVETTAAPSACAAAPRCSGRSGPPRSAGDPG